MRASLISWRLWFLPKIFQLFLCFYSWCLLACDFYWCHSHRLAVNLIAASLLTIKFVPADFYRELFMARERCTCPKRLKNDIKHEEKFNLKECWFADFYHCIYSCLENSFWNEMWSKDEVLKWFKNMFKSSFLSARFSILVL